jgi:hypothetical protein
MVAMSEHLSFFMLPDENGDTTPAVIRPKDLGVRFQRIRQWVPIHFAGVEPILGWQETDCPAGCLRAELG